MKAINQYAALPSVEELERQRIENEELSRLGFKVSKPKPAEDSSGSGLEATTPRDMTPGGTAITPRAPVRKKQGKAGKRTAAAARPDAPLHAPPPPPVSEPLPPPPPFPLAASSKLWHSVDDDEDLVVGRSRTNSAPKSDAELSRPPRQRGSSLKGTRSERSERSDSTAALDYSSAGGGSERESGVDKGSSILGTRQAGCIDRQQDVGGGIGAFGLHARDQLVRLAFDPVDGDPGHFFEVGVQAFVRVIVAG